MREKVVIVGGAPWMVDCSADGLAAIHDTIALESTSQAWAGWPRKDNCEAKQESSKRGTARRLNTPLQSKLCQLLHFIY